MSKLLGHERGCWLQQQPFIVKENLQVDHEFHLPIHNLWQSYNWWPHGSYEV